MNKIFKKPLKLIRKRLEIQQEREKAVINHFTDGKETELINMFRDEHLVCCKKIKLNNWNNDKTYRWAKIIKLYNLHC